ncbi:44432_t:CDS:2 [Gigaspora margarita]|uniref:44432_t:CDS:1 n=1 Tax=Gigaspora margarita TaxID=4874 RepID=A0ABN7VUV0_GIGMA|nr:44432_t:CDS:2 [Gigaspora margarita]
MAKLVALPPRVISNTVLPPRNTETSSETNIFTTSSSRNNTTAITSDSVTTLYAPVMKSSDEPFIPSYPKSTFVEKLKIQIAHYAYQHASKNIRQRPGVDDTQAESISTDFAVSTEVLLYYFEVDIMDKGEHGYEVALSEDLFPIVGSRTRGECVKANFGMKPFNFDIDSYAKSFFSETRVIAQGEYILNRLN